MTNPPPSRSLRRRRTLLAILLAVWCAWRIAPSCRSPLTLDSRERVIATEVARVRNGQTPTLFHWPGTPWTALLAATTAVAGTDSEVATARAGRLWVVVFSAVTLALFYRLACRRLSGNAALVATAGLALAPGLASGESGLALVDVPALALGLCGMRFAVLEVEKSPASAGTYSLLSGVCLGVGGAVKLPTLGLLLPAVGALTTTANVRPSKLGVRALSLVGGTVAGFAIGCPFLLLDLATGGDAVLDDFRYEFAHYRRGHFGLVATALDAPFAAAGRHLEAAAWAFGSWLTVVAVVGVAVWSWNLRRRWRDCLFEALWLVSTVGVLLVQRFTFPRHWLVALPPVLLVTLAGIESSRGRMRLVARVAFGTALVAAAVMTLGYDSLLRSTPTATSYERWFAAQRAKKPNVTVSVGPATPVLTWLYPDSAIRGEALASVGQVDAFIVAQAEADLQRSVASRPDAYRNGDFFPLVQRDFTTGAFFAELESSRDYACVARFEQPFPAWARWAAFPFTNVPLPLNMLFHPTLGVFARTTHEGTASTRPE